MDRGAVKPGIRSRIFAVAFPAMLFAPLLVGWRSVVAELERVAGEEHAATGRYLESLSRSLATELGRTEEDLQLFSRLPSIADYFSYKELGLPEEADEHRRRVLEYSREFRDRESTYATVGLFDADGALIAGYGSPARLPVRLGQTPAAGTCPADEPLRITAVTWATPAIREGLALQPVVAWLADRWGLPRAAVLVELDLVALRLRLGEGPQGHVPVLVDPAGRLVSSLPNPDLPLLAPLAASGPAGEAILVGLLAAASAPTRVAMGDSGEWELIGRATPVRGFRVGLMAPVEYVYQGVRRIQRQTLQIAALALVASFLLAHWVARRIGGRIVRLATAAGAVGEGRFDLRIPVDVEDELGQLAVSFNQMSAKVERTQRALEQRVVEVERARDSLVQAERLSAVGLLASGIAHEMNSPLMAIGTVAGSLRVAAEKPEVDREKLARYAELIAGEVQRASEITLSLQQYCRTGAGPLVPRPVDLNEVVARARILVGTRKESRRLAVERGEIPLTAGDVNQLSQVAINLILNALDACDGDQAVRVSTRAGRFEAQDLERAPRPDEGSPFCQSQRASIPGPGDPAVVMEVADEGCGIPPGHMAKLFDPFFTTKPAGKGTGLGLAIVLGIVWSHGGVLVVDSTPGQGTRIQVKLPRAQV